MTRNWTVGTLAGMGVAAMLLWPIDTATEAIVGGLVGGALFGVALAVATW